MTQLSFATLDHRNKKTQTKRERSLGEMDAVVPCSARVGKMEPYDPKAVKGRRSYPLEEAHCTAPLYRRVIPLAV